MNGLACSACGNTTTCIGQTSPNQEERHWMAGTVEIYKCNTCNTQTRFPRYNHPRKLLDSSLINKNGWFPKIDLDQGLKDTYSWYLENS